MGTIPAVSANQPSQPVLKPFLTSAARAMVPHPTMAQMLQEPLYQLKQQADAGNAVAKQVLAHEQDMEKQGQTPSGASGSSPEAGRVDILAG